MEAVETHTPGTRSVAHNKIDCRVDIKREPDPKGV